MENIIFTKGLRRWKGNSENVVQASFYTNILQPKNNKKKCSPNLLLPMSIIMSGCRCFGLEQLTTNIAHMLISFTVLFLTC